MVYTAKFEYRLSLHRLFASIPCTADKMLRLAILTELVYVHVFELRGVVWHNCKYLGKDPIVTCTSLPTYSALAVRVTTSGL